MPRHAVVLAPLYAALVSRQMGIEQTRGYEPRVPFPFFCVCCTEFVGADEKNCRETTATPFPRLSRTTYSPESMCPRFRAQVSAHSWPHTRTCPSSRNPSVPLGVTCLHPGGVPLPGKSNSYCSSVTVAASWLRCRHSTREARRVNIASPDPLCYTRFLMDVVMRKKQPSEAEQDLLAVRANRDVSFFDLTSIDQVGLPDLSLIFDVARRFRDYQTYKFSFNKGLSQVNAFFEPSTRTQASFDLAAKQLSMDTTSVGSASSSAKKGESFLDTVETLSAYNVRTIVIRCSQAGAPEFVARHVPAMILNAGDGWHEHPTQGLLDALTILDEFGTTDLAGKVVTIVGDIKHSRVFGSLVRILKKLNASVRVAAPETFLPDFVEQFGIETFWSVEEALAGADVIYALRVQEERGAKGDIPTLREYSKTFGISAKRLALAKPGAILMHPGPVMRDVDVHSALVARHPQSRILQQVENGSAVRKALLWLMNDRIDGKQKEYQLL